PTTACDVSTTRIVVTADSAAVTSRASINSPYFRRRTAKRLTLKEVPICSAPAGRSESVPQRLSDPGERQGLRQRRASAGFISARARGVQGGAPQRPPA